MELKIKHRTPQPFVITALFTIWIACGYIGYGYAANAPAVARRDHIKQNDSEAKSIIKLVIAGAKNRESRLQSPSVYFSKKSFLSQRMKESMREIGNGARIPALGPQLSKYFWTSDGLRWRCEQNRIVPKSQFSLTLDTYDGEKFYSYTPRAREGQVSRLPGSADFDSHLYWLMLSFNGKPISQFLQSHAVKFLGYQKIDGHKTIKLSVSDDTSKYSRKYYFWFDSKLGMAVRQNKIITGRKGEGPANVILIKAIAFKETAKGLWLPVRSERQMFEFDNGKPKWLFTDVFEVQKILLNTPGISCLFTIHFPLGAQVIPALDNKIYVVGGRVNKNKLSQEKAPDILNPGHSGALQ